MGRFIRLLSLSAMVGGVLLWRSKPKQQAENNQAGDVAADRSPGDANEPAPAGSEQNNQTVQQPHDAGSGAGQLASADPPAPRRIKGNRLRDDKIYHLPDDPSYDQVIEERLFATTAEAEAAGFRHVGQPRGQTSP